jgi:hypothetical protein
VDNTYRRGGLVGPILIIGVGAVLLLNTLGYLPYSIWTVLLRLWPVVLIAIGIDLLIGRRTLAGRLLALVLILALLGGGLWLAGVRLGPAGVPLGQGETVEQARALCFVTLIFSNLCLILTNRSWSKNVAASFSAGNKALAWVFGSAVVFLGSVIYIPFLRKIFLFALMHPQDLLLALFAGIMSIAWFELVKIVSSLFGIELLKT